MSQIVVQHHEMFGERMAPVIMEKADTNERSIQNEKTIELPQPINVETSMDIENSTGIERSPVSSKSTGMEKADVTGSSIDNEKALVQPIKIETSMDLDKSTGVERSPVSSKSIEMEKADVTGSSIENEKTIEQAQPINIEPSIGKENPKDIGRSATTSKPTEMGGSMRLEDSKHKRLRRALANPTGQMLSKPINTLLAPFSVSATAAVFNALKGALSDTRCRVRHLDQVEPGDHVVLRSKRAGLVDKMIMGHHAIVERVNEQEGTLTIIHYYSHVFEKNPISVRLHPQFLVTGTVMESTIYLDGDYSIYKIKHSTFANDTETILERAQSRIGEQEFNFFLNNDEHFAYFCKTGTPKSCRNKLYVLKMARVTIKLYTLGKSIYLLIGGTSRVKRYIYSGISSIKRQFHIPKESVFKVQEIPCSSFVYGIVNRWAFKMANSDVVLDGTPTTLEDNDSNDPTAIANPQDTKAKKGAKKRVKSKRPGGFTKEEKEKAMQLGSQLLARTLGHGLAEAGSKIVAEKAVEKGSYFAVSRIGARAAEQMGKNAAHHAGGHAAQHLGKQAAQQVGKNALHHAGKNAIHHVGKNAIHHAGKNAMHHVGKNAINHIGKNAVHHVGKNAVQHAAKGAAVRTAVASAGKGSTHTVSGALRAATRGQSVAIGLGALVSIGFATKDIMRAKKEKKEGTMSSGQYNELVTKKVAGATTDIALATYGTVMGTVLAGPVGAIVGGFMGSMVGSVVGEQLIGTEISKSDIAPNWSKEDGKEHGKEESKGKGTEETDEKKGDEKEEVKKENVEHEKTSEELSPKIDLSNQEASVADETAVKVILNDTKAAGDTNATSTNEKVDPGKESINELFGAYFDTILGRTPKVDDGSEAKDSELKEEEMDQREGGTSFTSGLWSSIFGSLDQNEHSLQEEREITTQLNDAEVVGQPQVGENSITDTNTTAERKTLDYENTPSDVMSDNIKGACLENKENSWILTNEDDPVQNSSAGPADDPPDSDIHNQSKHDVSQDRNVTRSNENAIPVKGATITTECGDDQEGNFNAHDGLGPSISDVPENPVKGGLHPHQTNQVKQQGIDELFGSYFDSLRSQSHDVPTVAQQASAAETNSDETKGKGEGKSFTSGLWGSLFGSLDWREDNSELEVASPKPQKTEVGLAGADMIDIKINPEVNQDEGKLGDVAKTDVVQEKLSANAVNNPEGNTASDDQCESANKTGVLAHQNVEEVVLNNHTHLTSKSGNEDVVRNNLSTVGTEAETTLPDGSADTQDNFLESPQVVGSATTGEDLRGEKSRTMNIVKREDSSQSSAQMQGQRSGFSLFSFNPLKRENIGRIVGGLLQEFFGDEEGNTDDDTEDVTNMDDLRKAVQAKGSETDVTAKENLAGLETPDTGSVSEGAEVPGTAPKATHLENRVSLFEEIGKGTDEDVPVCKDINRGEENNEVVHDANCDQAEAGNKDPSDINMVNTVDRSSLSQGGRLESDLVRGTDKSDDKAVLSDAECSDLFDSDDCSIDLDAISIKTDDLLADSDIDIDIDAELQEAIDSSSQEDKKITDNLFQNNAGVNCVETDKCRTGNECRPIVQALDGTAAADPVLGVGADPDNTLVDDEGTKKQCSDTVFKHKVDSELEVETIGQGNDVESVIDCQTTENVVAEEANASPSYTKTDITVDVDGNHNPNKISINEDFKNIFKSKTE